MYTAEFYEVKLPDSRTLAGHVVGPEHGRPVLFVAGAGTGKSMTFGEELLDRLEVRLLTMDRPGMGQSTHAEDRTVASTASDYRAFVNGVLGESSATIPVVANSQGAVFGLSMACLGMTRSLVLVSPADEIAFPAIHKMLPPTATQLSDLAVVAPAEAREVLQRFSAEAMEHMVLAGAPASDAAFYTSEPFRSRYRRSLAEGFSHDGAGYIQDTLLAMRPWKLDLTRVRSKVHILFGADDHSHSPDHGQTLSQRIPAAVREVIPQVGGALLWTHSEKALAHALD